MSEIAVIGGGLSGSALAIRLARAGRRVTLIERESGPHDKVCGEFLSREALLHLAALGIDPLRLGGRTITRARLSSGGHTVTLALPFAAVGLSRSVLDNMLLDSAATSGATVLRGRRVQALQPDGAGHRIRCDDGTALLADEAVLATGKHELRGWKRPPGLQNDLVGFKLHLQLQPEQTRALDDHVELMLFDGGYAGLQPVGDKRATLCLLVGRRLLSRIGGWTGLLAAMGAQVPLLARRLDGATRLHERPLSIGAIPYGLLAPDPGPVWRLGDQAAVIPSFTGDGMSIALHSAALCAGCLARGDRPPALQAAIRRDVGPQVVRATQLSRIAVRAPMRHFVLGAARLLPSLAVRFAQNTRIPDAALRRAGVL